MHVTVPVRQLSLHSLDKHGSLQVRRDRLIRHVHQRAADDLVCSIAV